MYGRLRRFDEGLHERVLRLFEDEREGDLHSIDAEVVFKHIIFYDVFSVTWIAHCHQRFLDEIWIERHYILNLVINSG